MTGVLVAVLLCVALALAPAAACAQGNTGVAQPRVQVLTKPPQLLRSVEAVYPKAALDAGVEGDVVLKVTIDAEGRVVEASVLRGPEPLHQPALAAVRQFVFSPAEVNGAPAPVTLPFTLTFELPQLPAAIAGVIRDPTGEPRAGITLVVVPEGASVTDASQRRVTGADGAFDLEDLEPGSWELIARDAAAGEELGRVVVRLESGKRARVVFTLEEFEAPVGVEPELEERGGEEENRVTTRAQRDVRSTTKRRLSLEEVRLIPGARGDVVRVVQNLPGVARPRLGTGDFVVRGAAPQDTLILLEGDVVPGVFHFLGGPAVLQPEMIETIEFYPGNFDVQYGRATAGVLNLRSRVPRADTFHGFAKVDLIDSTLMLEGPVPGIDGLSIALSGRRSYLDALLSPLIDERSAGFVVPRYYDYQGWITYEGVRHHTISLQIYGSNDKLRLLGSTGAPEPEEQMSQQQQEDEEEAFGLTNGFHRGQVRWSWDPVGPVRNELSVSFGVSGTRLDIIDFVFDTQVTQSVLRDDLRIELSDAVELRFGLDFQLGRTDIEIVEPPGSGQDEDEGPPPPDDQVYPDNVSFVSTLEDQSLLNPAYYADMVFKPWEGATFVPGVRVDQFGATSQLSISPRLTARQQLGAVTIKGGAGIFTQPPQPLFTNPVFGDRDLLPEFSAQYSLGAEWQLTEALMVDAEVFYRDMRRLVVQDFEIFIRDDGTADFTLFSNDGRGRAYGAELLVKHDLRERVFGWLAYTLSRSERLNLRSKQWDLYRNDQTHILTLVGGYKFPRGFTLSSRLRLVSGFPFTPVVDSVYDVDAVRFEPVYGEPNSAREVFFRQLDVRAEKEWTKQWGSIAAFLDVINATNARNVESSVYTYDWRQRREVTGFPFIPTLGVQARW